MTDVTVQLPGPLANRATAALRAAMAFCDTAADQRERAEADR